MKSLFANSSHNTNNASHDGPSTRQGVDEPDETTRLLPNRIDSGDPGSAGYLSPDDPAVSPYNLFSVRFARGVTVVFLTLSLVWWVLLLVASFVTPPGFETRGSPFTALAYSTLAAATLVVSLMFFAAPSRLVRILTAVVAFLLLVNVIVTAAVERTRHEEGWVGISSVTWSLLVAVWTIVSDRTVQWGKREEEERLTGRPETRRTLLEWIQVTASSISLVILCAATLLMTFQLILRAVDAGLAPPGNRYWVDDGKYQVHLYCHGSKSKEPLPTVLLEGGEDPVENGLWQFADNSLQNGSINRYCFVDRPGFGWSDTSPSPMSAGQATEALSEALAHAGEVGPWVVVGAGVGALYARVFSARHGAEVDGLLLIDPLHEDLLAQRLGNARRGFLLWLRGVMSPLGLDRVPGVLLRGRTREDRIWGRSAYQNTKNIFAKLQESLVAGSLTRRDVVTSRAIQYRDTPLAVVSSGDAVKRNREGWANKQEDLTHLTHALVAWDVVGGAPHEVWRTLDGRSVLEKRLRKLVHHSPTKAKVNAGGQVVRDKVAGQEQGETP